MRTIMAAILALTMTAGQAPQAPPSSDVSAPIHRGLALRLIRWRGQAVRVLVIDPTYYTVRGIPSGQHFPTRHPPSEVVRHSAAVATVGGDFQTLMGTPIHIFMNHRELWTTGLQHGWAYESAGDSSYIGQTWFDIELHREHGPAIQIKAWNAPGPRGGDVVAFSRRGGTVWRPKGKLHPRPHDKRFCAALLVPTGHHYWNPSKTTDLRAYTVRAQPQPCKKVPMKFTTEHSVILNSRGRGKASREVRSLNKGQRVTIGMNFGHPAVTDIAGGMPQVVLNGRNVAPNHGTGTVRRDSSTGVKGPDGSFYSPNPRTALGITRGCQTGDNSCRIFEVTIDGRLPDWSCCGVRLPGLAQFMIHLGAYQAMNLDGGGSTMMWLRHRGKYCQSRRPSGCLVNRTSYGERPNVDAVAVVPRG